MIHVYPSNDLEEHLLTGSDCKCQPRIEGHEGELIIIHNSFDGREGVEIVNEILKQTKPYDTR